MVGRWLQPLRLACLHDQRNVTFMEDRLLSNQSEQFKKLSKNSDWQENAGPPKTHFGFGHAIRQGRR